MPGQTSKRGADAEALACRYLSQHGLRVRERNFRTRWGELDIVMEDGHQLVFVEVRYRKNDFFGGALASITSHKQVRLLRAASVYMQKHGLGHRPARFDIVAINGENSELDWLPDAIRPNE